MQLTRADRRLIDQLTETLPLKGVRRLGVAVSGGSDSLALLLLLTELAAEKKIPIEAITVDHGLREEAAEEAQFVRAVCGKRQVPHAIARWTGWDGDGNLQDAARQARYRMIAEWANHREIDLVCLGHTQDDVAETFLMRLERESGVDGLARMQDHFERDGAAFCRPILDMTRADLRAFLNRRDQEWRDDPSNANEAFSRVRARRALKVLDDLGITPATLASVAENMSDARDALRDGVAALAREIVTQEDGDLLIDRDAFLDAHTELRRRLLTQALTWMVPADYPPRRAPLKELDQAIREQRNFSLNGCLVYVRKSEVRIAREYNAVRELCEFAPAWDRWVLTGPWTVGMCVKALGEPEISGLKDWRSQGIPRQTLMASPAVWYHDTLIAAPLAGFGEAWTMQLKGEDFLTAVAAG
jgi:tRNA(Ile)-lysidine synthase